MSAKFLEWALHSRGPLCSHGHLPDERQYSASSEPPFPSGLYKDGLVGVYQACSMGTSQADPWGGGLGDNKTWTWMLGASC